MNKYFLLCTVLSIQAGCLGTVNNCDSTSESDSSSEGTTVTNPVNSTNPSDTTSSTIMDTTTSTSTETTMSSTSSSTTTSDDPECPTPIDPECPVFVSIDGCVITHPSCPTIAPNVKFITHASHSCLTDEYPPLFCEYMGDITCNAIVAGVWCCEGP